MSENDLFVSIQLEPLIHDYNIRSEEKSYSYYICYYLCVCCRCNN